jgi:hypothetical protein
MLEGGIEPVGYRVITKDFDFSAIYETDGTVNVYVEWGDDQSGDMFNHPSMSEAKRHLEMLLKASEPKQPKKPMSQIVNESVTEGLQKVGLPDTPHNRLMVLGDVHKNFREDGVGNHTYREVMHIVEDEIIRLTDQL